MKYSLLAAPLALVLLTGSWSGLLAQQPRPSRPGTAGQPAPGTGRQQPEDQPAKAPVRKAAAEAREEEFPITAELEQILQDWEDKSAQIKSLHGTHKRTVYNTVFEEERRASGRFFLKTPDMGRIDLVGTKPRAGEKSARIGASGNPYRIQADNAEKWICTGKEVVAVNDEEKSYEVIPLPKEAQGSNIINSPLPFLFGMKAEDAKRRYRIKLHRNTPDNAVLIVYPRFASDRQNYVEAWIILEKENYLPTAVKMYDPTGKLETVYMFEAKVNDRSVWTNLNVFFGRDDRDPFHPNLKAQGYKLVLPPAEEIAAPRRNPPNTRSADLNR